MASALALTFKTHYLDSAIRSEFRKLRKECAHHDVFLLHNQSTYPIFPKRSRFLFTNRDLLRSGYPLVHPWYDAHFPLLLFYRRNPHYDYYWQVEYDVRYTGNWADVVDRASPCDLLTTFAYEYHQIPKFPFWEGPSIPFPKQRMRFTFMPVMRISRPALEYLDSLHQRGTSAFSEVILGTFLREAGFSSLTLKEAIAVPAGAPGLSYDETTFRWRPVFDEVGNRPNTLYHPVRKPPPLYGRLFQKIASLTPVGLPSHDPLMKKVLNTMATTDYLRPTSPL